MTNIVLLSDGTGNGAGKRNKTNVWRLYRALDLTTRNQVALYDDGVGSQEWLPLKLLGGAVGFGLKRNVLQLYEFLCRNYRPGDKIYMFGFSRGAFTARVLAAMVAYCGLVSGAEDEETLRHATRDNYRAFRWRFRHGYLVRIFYGLNPPQIRSDVRPNIKFVGVWDTVDAYGLPMDELAVLWDRLIYPIRFPDQDLSPKVLRARHAVSVDDERLTFSPVLWNEAGETDPDRIVQVWFPGVHSNVGGGYPQDELSYVPLNWMISQVEAPLPSDPGLHFIASHRAEIRALANPHGRQYDSRSGVAAYYRYRPRDIERLCHDGPSTVEIETPKIHQSVFDRIKGDVVPYAPLGLPAAYEIVPADPASPPPQYETTAAAAARKVSLNHAWDIVYWRRWLYYALLAATAVLLLSRFFLDWSPGGACQGKACFFDPAIALISNVVPGFAAAWLEALRQNPVWLWGFAIAFAILFGLKFYAHAVTERNAVAAWSMLKKGASFPPPAWRWTFTSYLRDDSRAADRFTSFLAALLIFLVLAWLAIALVDRAIFTFIDTTGGTCAGSPDAANLTVGQSKSADIDIANPCNVTTIEMEEGATYEITVAPVPGDATGLNWQDGTVAAGPDGWEPGWHHVQLAPFLPFRRDWSTPWFRLVGRVGQYSTEQFAIGRGPTDYTAKSDGPLYLFVNDAVFGLALGNWAMAYTWERGRNVGTARITVTRTE